MKAKLELKISITPLNVGFDLRKHNRAVNILAHTDAVEYESGGEIKVARGTIEEIKKELEAAGYMINIT